MLIQLQLHDILLQILLQIIPKEQMLIYYNYIIYYYYMFQLHIVIIKYL